MIILLTAVFPALAQDLTTVPDGGNKKASVSERIGITDVSLHYDRPAVKGREGKIWGQLVAYGFSDPGFGTSKAAPWRAGANENTTINFSTDVQVEGKPLAAGTYALFIAVEEQQATVIFSKNATSWGSFFYDPKEDALRVTVKPVATTEKTERLKYEFSDETENSATISLSWEFLRIPFRVAVDLPNTQWDSFQKELRSNKGFNANAWVQAINFAVANNIHLEEALQMSNYAINGVFVGQKNFKTLSAKAAVLKKLNRNPEAEALMKEALPMATMQELHTYGRQMLAAKQPAVALEAFQLNAKKNPNVFTTNMGLARGYSANGDFKNAAKYAKAALLQAPDAQNKTAIEGYIKSLEAGKDIN
ncbi:MAG: hypothetical protein JWQ27_1861 [Ferruginibacter sp.]|nr:hypothetical protein [Ferruginibacter sp.]